jgi:hypothetical protein
MTNHKPPFLAEYTHRGERYSVIVGGDSWAEAEQHLRSIGNNGRVVGSDVISVSANAVTLPFAHAYATIYSWIRNALR